MSIPKIPLGYPVSFQRKRAGGLHGRLIDFPQRTVAGLTREEIVAQLLRPLVEELHHLVYCDLPMREPTTYPLKGQWEMLYLPVMVRLKLSLQMLIRARGISRRDLQTLLQCNPIQLNRLLSPFYTTRLSEVETAFRKLDCLLDLQIVEVP